jgi:hypothetical protein
MAYREINLIASKKAFTPEERAVRKLLTTWTPIVLVGYLLVLTGILGYFYVLSFNVSQTETAIGKEKQLISAREKDEGLYLLVKQKASALNRIFTERYPYTTIYDFFANINQEGTSIKSIKLADDGNAVLDVSADDTYKLDTFIKTLLASAKIYFNRVELIGVQYSPKGVYTVTLDINTKNTL